LACDLLISNKRHRYTRDNNNEDQNNWSPEKNNYRNSCLGINLRRCLFFYFGYPLSKQLTVFDRHKDDMNNLFKKGRQILNEVLSQYEQLRVNAENEQQAMRCGAFNPRFLAKIKRSKTATTRIRTKKKR